jgi:hypothetical protein
MQLTYTTCLRMVFEVCSTCHILYLSTQYVSSTFEIYIFRSIVFFIFFYSSSYSEQICYYHVINAVLIICKLM